MEKEADAEGPMCLVEAQQESFLFHYFVSFTIVFFKSICLKSHDVTGMMTHVLVYGAAGKDWQLRSLDVERGCCLDEFGWLLRLVGW